MNFEGFKKEMRKILGEDRITDDEAAKLFAALYVYGKYQEREAKSAARRSNREKLPAVELKNNI